LSTRGFDALSGKHQQEAARKILQYAHEKWPDRPLVVGGSKKFIAAIRQKQPR